MFKLISSFLHYHWSCLIFQKSVEVSSLCVTYPHESIAKPRPPWEKIPGRAMASPSIVVLFATRVEMKPFLIGRRRWRWIRERMAEAYNVLQISPRNCIIEPCAFRQRLYSSRQSVSLLNRSHLSHTASTTSPVYISRLWVGVWNVYGLNRRWKTAAEMIICNAFAEM